MNFNDPTSVGVWAELVNRYGFMLIFSIVSGAFNIIIVFQFLTGRLYTKAMYERAIKEAERLQKSMEDDRALYMTKLLEFMGGTKPNENRGDGQP